MSKTEQCNVFRINAFTGVSNLRVDSRVKSRCVRNSLLFFYLIGVQILCAGCDTTVSPAERVETLRDERDLAALELLLHDPDPQVRWRAVASLGEIASMSSLPAIQRRVRDSDEFVRLHAANSWRKIDPTQSDVAVRTISQSLAGKSDGVRRTALSMLCEIELRSIDPSVSETVRRMMDDPSTSVQSAAIRAIATAADVEVSLSAILDQLRSPDPYVRRTAVDTLGGLIPTLKLKHRVIVLRSLLPMITDNAKCGSTGSDTTVSRHVALVLQSLTTTLDEVEAMFPISGG